MALTTNPATYVDLDRMPIAGRWRDGGSGEARADVDPYSGEELCRITQADAEDVEEAFTAAVAAQPAWAAAAPSARRDVLLEAARVMDARKDEVITWMVRETGATAAKAELDWSLSRGDMLEAAGMCSRVAGRIMPSEVPGKESRVYRRPVGVVAVISPWNVPMHLGNRAVAAALAVGNAVVLKPSSDTPVCGGTLLARIYEEAGLAPELLSVVVGPGGEVGDALTSHRAARVVAFTGSTPVGEGIIANAGVKRLALELGGNGPMVVLEDADLDRAAGAAVFGSFFHAGQVCMIANRLVVVDAVFDDFLERFLGRARALTVGDPSQASTHVGPIINESQRDGILDKVSRAVGDGAQLVMGGDPFGPTGLLLPIHVLVGGNDVATAGEEVFGPVITVVRARDEEHALEIANDTELGLSSAVFTEDVERGVRFAMRVEAGMTHVNDSPLNDELNTAFGGVGDSGLGRFNGDWSLDEFTTEHWISVQHEPRSYAL